MRGRGFNAASTLLSFLFFLLSVFFFLSFFQILRIPAYPPSHDECWNDLGKKKIKKSEQASLYEMFLISWPYDIVLDR